MAYGVWRMVMPHQPLTINHKLLTKVYHFFKSNKKPAIRRIFICNYFVYYEPKPGFVPLIAPGDA